jgi:7tm Chemosensory receptor
MENIYSSVKPFYNLSKILGLFPLSFDGSETKGRLELKWHGVVSCVVTVLILTLLLFMNFLDEEDPSSSAMLNNVWNFQVVFGLILLLILFIYQIKQRNAIADYLQIIKNIDDKVKCSKTSIIDKFQHLFYVFFFS